MMPPWVRIFKHSYLTLLSLLGRKPNQQGNTKKERIAQLLMDQSRRMTAREIAEIVGRTESNVFKEKPRLKTTGILSDSELTIFSQSDQNDSLTLAHAKATTLVTQTEYKSLTDIPPLSQNDLKKLYFEFMRGKTPVQIIAEFGFNPRLVELEYDRFLRLNGFRVTSLLSAVMAKYSLNSNQTATAIIEKASHNGVLSNPDFLTIIEAVLSYSISLAEASFWTDYG